MSSSDASFSAVPLDHQLGPPAPTAAERRGLALALVAAAVLHLLIPLALVIYYALWPPAVAPTEQEIPVEVVVEPPPKQEQQEDKPKPPPQPEDERPAYDAPSAPTKEQANRESPDAKTQAPAAEPHPQQNLGAPQQSETPPAAQEQKAEASSPPELAKPTPNAEEAAAAQSPSDTNATPPVADVEPKPAPPPAPKPPPTAPAGAPPPTDEVLPAYKFAHAATESPITGGNADTRYFTIVYGMIRSHFRSPSGSGGPPNRGGAVIFTVDETGNLLQRKLVTSSGSPSLDMAVMAAIAEAAPYPAPPNWQPRSMRLTYGR